MCASAPPCNPETGRNANYFSELCGWIGASRGLFERSEFHRRHRAYPWVQRG